MLPGGGDRLCLGEPGVATHPRPPDESQIHLRDYDGIAPALERSWRRKHDSDSGSPPPSLTLRRSAGRSHGRRWRSADIWPGHRRICR
jgi:hypothetical protein